jgi:hypothetical protein
MIDLNALDNDPWPTFPTKKDDLRALASALQGMEADLARVTKDASRFYEALLMMAIQNQEPLARNMARRVLGMEPVKDSGLII